MINWRVVTTSSTVWPGCQQSDGKHTFQGGDKLETKVARSWPVISHPL